ncbi:MAG: response regulator, partial [Desulfobacterium sp.]|nr:response regulator [Desulfobacterium sp.]
MIEYTLYIVDDEKTIREGIAFELEDDYRVLKFETAEAALEQFSTEPPDLILLDIGLPGMSGNQALKEFKSLKPDVLVIMITAYENIKLVIECMKSGAHDYIIKPIHMETLEISIANALETIRLRKEIEAIQEKQIRENLPCFIGASR